MKKKFFIFLGGNLVLLILFPMMFFFMVIGGASAAQNNSGGDVNVSPITPNMTQQQFIDLIAPLAVETYHEYGVLPSITLAQAILESEWGKSGLTVKADALFGIKADKSWKGATIDMMTTEEVNGSIISVMATWRAYGSVEESVMDHGKFLQENSTYKDHGLFDATDYVGQANALKAAGYATESDYPTLLITLIKEYNLNQYDYDSQ